MTGFIDIATVWAFIIAFAVFVYVVMDGFSISASAYCSRYFRTRPIAT